MKESMQAIAAKLKQLPINGMVTLNGNIVIRRDEPHDGCSNRPKCPIRDILSQYLGENGKNALYSMYAEDLCEHAHCKVYYKEKARD